MKPWASYNLGPALLAAEPRQRDLSVEGITMKRFSCGDVVPGCTSTFESDTEAGILTQVAHHATTDHGLDTVPPELVNAVRSKIQDLPRK